MGLDACKLCPRMCGVNRMEGELGFCQAGTDVKIARAALHYWEEPCISGERGSGTVFFSHCTLKCMFCQNYDISTMGKGKELKVGELAQIFMVLQEDGAHNINLVTPTHYVIQIIEALKQARNMGLKIPIIYNSSGYETVETIRRLEGFIDVYLPDFKYFKDKYAVAYSKAPGYNKYAKTAIEEMLRQVGEATFNDEGIIQKGVIIRHLMLPGLLFDTKKIVDYIYNTYGEKVYISLMNQYTPLKQVKEHPKLSQKLSVVHYEYMVEYAITLGISNGFIQEGDTASESFIPPFNEEI